MKKKFNEIFNETVQKNISESDNLNEFRIVGDDEQEDSNIKLTDYMRRMYNRPSMYNLSTAELERNRLRDDRIEFEKERTLRRDEYAYNLDKERMNIQRDLEKEQTTRMNNYYKAANDAEKNVMDFDSYVLKNNLDFNSKTFGKYMDYRMEVERQQGLDYRQREKRMENENIRQTDATNKLELKRVEQQMAQTDKQLDNDIKRYEKQLDYDVKEIEARYKRDSERAKANASVRVAQANADSSIRSAEIARDTRQAELTSSERLLDRVDARIQYVEAIRNSLNGNYSRIFDLYSRDGNDDQKNNLSNLILYVHNKELVTVNGTDYDFSTGNQTTLNNTISLYLQNNRIRNITPRDIIRNINQDIYTEFTDTEEDNASLRPANFNYNFDGGVINFLNDLSHINDWQENAERAYAAIARRTGGGNGRSNNRNRNRNRRTIREDYELTSEYEKKLIFGDILENIKDITVINEINAGNVNAAWRNANKEKNPTEKNRLTSLAKSMEMENVNKEFFDRTSEQLENVKESKDPLTNEPDKQYLKGNEINDPLYNKPLKEEEDLRLMALKQKKENIRKQKEKNAEKSETEIENVDKQITSIQNQNAIQNQRKKYPSTDSSNNPGSPDVSNTGF